MFGGLEARAENFLYELADLATRPAARDSTRYTRCVRGFVQYHLQRISLGIIRGGALGMWDELQKLAAPRARAACRLGPHAAQHVDPTRAAVRAPTVVPYSAVSVP